MNAHTIGFPPQNQKTEPSLMFPKLTPSLWVKSLER